MTPIDFSDVKNQIMKIINEIIDNLSSDSPCLTNALLKAKILFHKLGEDEPRRWVDAELNGYQEGSPVPDYRIIDSTVVGNFANMAYRHTNQALPIAHLEERLRKYLQVSNLTQSIAVIEGYSLNDEKISFSIQPEYYPLLSNGLAPGYHVQSAWGKPSAGCMTQVVTVVRSRLLDFILTLADRMPQNIPDEKMKDISKEIDTNGIFKDAMFGNNTTIIIGNNNKQNITNKTIQNDIESLSKALQTHGISASDVESLKQAIKSDIDSPEHQQRKYGNNVQSWYDTMITEASIKAVNLSEGVVASLLATAINSYYGWF